MGLISGSVLWIIMASAGSLAANVGLNTLQSWYDPLYVDYFWGSQGLSPDRRAQLAEDEARVSAMMADDSDAGSAGAGASHPVKQDFALSGVSP